MILIFTSVPFSFESSPGPATERQALAMNSIATESVDCRELLNDAQKASRDGGATLDLSDRGIREIPPEVSELIKGEVSR